LRDCREHREVKWYTDIILEHKNTIYIINGTSSSAIAERPRDTLSQLKSCQLLHNFTKNHIWLEGLPFPVA